MSEGDELVIGLGSFWYLSLTKLIITFWLDEEGVLAVCERRPSSLSWADVFVIV